MAVERYIETVHHDDEFETEDFNNHNSSKSGFQNINKFIKKRQMKRELKERQTCIKSITIATNDVSTLLINFYSINQTTFQATLNKTSHQAFDMNLSLNSNSNSSPSPSSSLSSSPSYSLSNFFSSTIKRITTNILRWFEKFLTDVNGTAKIKTTITFDLKQGENKNKGGRCSNVSGFRGYKERGISSEEDVGNAWGMKDGFAGEFWVDEVVVVNY